ncbi:peptidoglycan D,D-transpeptidase FtsI family protein [Hydrogenimonas thermophila]|uniref:Cell division protein FtsI (Penicillin-binding protein 3) n=1 Tax=Hydrogenimonas thermophila TaxID=223786 RepID=A0A1I5P382_9BACT|nr:penicillin-binding protein 2 [Hydrogenimonas thermophila]WOE69591.1 penicillin-binding protein 2 [Hydrogenimonas thermophila]WOE72105.1 penicillin-binding protein 2 [Hydrogenimonas thermophila]SFP28548.1 cell division protein FtsI (penicillin-binding protein 3) [Hydrogenimonas thermophila]
MSNFFSSSKELDERIGKKTKLLLLLIIFTFGIFVFIGSISHTAIKERHIPRLVISETNRALRGDILSKEGFKLAFSQKLYKAMVNTYNIDPDKKDLFIKLFSIYSGISEKTIRKRVSKKGNVVLSYSIDANRAKYLKELARKLRILKVFIPYEDKKGHIIKYGLSLTESGESRIFSYKDSFEPILGFMKKSEDDGFTRPIGVKGLEKSYQEALRPIQNGIVEGLRDIGNSIILDGNSFVKPPINGMTLLLNIPMSLQKSIEVVLQKAKRELQAKEIVAIVMDSKTGKIRAMATSNRFDPSHIRKRDYPSLNVTAIEYTYEPGSVIKPITFSLLLQNHRVNPYDIVRTYNGRYKLGRKIITDEHREEWMSAENVIVYSSNIGIAQLAQRLDGIDFIEGFKKFGFTQKTGIDLPYEHVGIMPNTLQMENEIYKATVGYGYGIRTTLIQLVCAYNAFNNNGRILEPKIVDTIIDHTGKRYQVESFTEPKQAITAATATQMNKILQKVVKKGTGKKARTEGLIIGGKTGTAHIASKKGGYAQLYNSTFIGFANDKKHRYTIGVLVREPKKPHSYYASQSAVPVFKQIVDVLVEQGELIPERSNP